MNQRIRIELFGGLRVIEETGERAFSGVARSSALLAYLACHLHRPHSRDELMEILWPEVDPEVGRNRLNVTFSRLRTDLGPIAQNGSNVFISDRHQIALNRELVITDVSEFKSHLASASNGAAAADRIQSLESAIQLYRGPLLHGFYDPWVSPEQESLREDLGQAYLRLIGLLEEEGRLDDAISVARRS